MAENFLNTTLNNNLKNPFGFRLPERTMRQVKESALNLLKDVVKPITDIGVGKEDFLNGSVVKEINSYQKLINSVNMNMAAADVTCNRLIDFKS